MRRPAAVGLVATVLVAIALVASSLAGAAKVEPILLPGASNQGKECSDNVGAGQSWTQLKIDPNADGVYSDGTLQVTISNTQDDKTFDWSSNIGVDAVIVKGGNDGSYLYRYDPPSEQTSDSGLTTPGVNGISHISFCYDVDPKGSLTVVKKVVNVDGEAESGDWTMNVDGPTDLSFPGADDPGTTNQVDPGDYTVTESGGPSGYTLVYSGDCNANGNVTVPANGSATCVLTNIEHEQPPPEKGTIIVKKQTNPTGAAGSFDFTASYDQDGFSLSDGQQNTSDPLPADTYSVSENVPAGWTLESATCDNGDSPSEIDLLAGATVTCTFVNAKVTEPGTIIVKKVTDPSGDDTEFDFTLGNDEFTLADGEQEVFDDLEPGTYSVSENTPEGWELTSATCSDHSQPSAIDLAEGETVTCTFTNTKVHEPGTIIVEKVTVPSGDETEFQFTFGEGEEFSLSDGESETFGDLEAGTYSVSESTPTGWDLTSAVCDDESDPDEIELSEGETVTCTFTNTKRGTIIVEKQTNPHGAHGSFTFTGDAAGTIGDDGQIVVPNLVPGVYSSTEGAAEGWLLTSIECDNEGSTGDLGNRTATFHVGAGETVTCVFTNTMQTVGKGSIDVQKSATPTSVKEPGGQVAFSVRITNTSTVDVTITNVVDDKFGDLDDSGGNGCFDVPINLEPGEFASCQFNGQVTGAAGTEHVNVVTASGNDEFGNPVSDSDDARVTITPRLIDLVIVKDATSPTPLNGIVHYSLTVTNKGPDTATNVQLADPAPAGITYLTANPSQGSCAVGPALVTCALGTIAPGQTVTIAITARATAVGTHTNTATVTGSGGAETNPADNVDSAVTVVPAPLTPPVKPKPPAPAQDVCLTLTVTPKMIKADGKADRVVAQVRAARKPMKGTRVLIRGVGIRKSGVTNGKGVAVIVINPRKPGIITITTIGNGDSCGAKRIGVVGVFLPPLTG